MGAHVNKASHVLLVKASQVSGRIDGQEGSDGSGLWRPGRGVPRATMVRNVMVRIGWVETGLRACGGRRGWQITFLERNLATLRTVHADMEGILSEERQARSVNNSLTIVQYNVSIELSLTSFSCSCQTDTGFRASV